MAIDDPMEVQDRDDARRINWKIIACKAGITGRPASLNSSFPQRSL
jgi:hypothetical protein